MNEALLTLGLDSNAGHSLNPWHIIIRIINWQQLVLALHCRA